MRFRHTGLTEAALISTPEVKELELNDDDEFIVLVRAKAIHSVSIFLASAVRWAKGRAARCPHLYTGV